MCTILYISFAILYRKYTGRMKVSSPVTARRDPMFITAAGLLELEGFPSIESLAGLLLA